MDSLESSNRSSVIRTRSNIGGKSTVGLEGGEVQSCSLFPVFICLYSGDATWRTLEECRNVITEDEAWTLMLSLLEG